MLSTAEVTYNVLISVQDKMLQKRVGLDTGLWRHHLMFTFIDFSPSERIFKQLLIHRTGPSSQPSFSILSAEIGGPCPNISLQSRCTDLSTSLGTTSKKSHGLPVLLRESLRAAKGSHFVCYAQVWSQTVTKCL